MSLNNFKKEMSAMIKDSSEKSFKKAMETEYGNDPKKHSGEMAKNFGEEMDKLLTDKLANSIDDHIKMVFTSLSAPKDDGEKSKKG